MTKFRDILFDRLDSLREGNKFNLYLIDEEIYLEGIEYSITRSTFRSLVMEYYRTRKEWDPGSKKFNLPFNNEIFISHMEFGAYLEAGCIHAEVTNVPYEPPVFESNGATMINRWRYPTIVKNIKEGFSVKSPNYDRNAFMFRKFVNSLCGNDEYSSNYLLQWTKEIMFDETKHDVWIILVNFHQGTGKTTFCDLMGSILEGSVSSAKTSQIEGRFNAFLDGKVLCFVSEWNPRSADQEYIKSLADSYVDIELKGKDTKTKRNYTNFIFSTNREDIFSTLDQDRRKAILVGEQGNEFKDYKIGFLKEEHPDVVEWLAENSSNAKVYNQDFLSDIAYYIYSGKFLDQKIAYAGKPTHNLHILKEKSEFDLIAVLESFCYDNLTQGVKYPIRDLSVSWKEYASKRGSDFRSLNFISKKREYRSEFFTFKVIHGTRYIEVNQPTKNTTEAITDDNSEQF